MKFLIISVLCSLIYTVNSQLLQTVDAATQLILDQISGGDQNLLSDNEEIDIEKEVTYYLLSRENPEFIQIYENDPNITQTLFWKPIVFIVHGWMQDKDKPWVLKLANAWIKAVDCFVIAVDYKRLASYTYGIAATRHVPKVGAYLCKFLQTIKLGGVLGSSMTIAGHSLGAHVAGIAGACSGDLGTIFALDAAGPLFTYPTLAPITNRLEETDATYVSVIHTTTTLGTAVDIGHSDFYMDAGTSIQCGCPLASDVTNPIEPLCSHTMSITYMIRTLDQNIKCKGVQGCSSILGIYKTKVCAFDFLSSLPININPYKQAASSTCIYDIFGIYSERKSGRFWVPTKAAEPHCFG